MHQTGAAEIEFSSSQQGAIPPSSLDLVFEILCLGNRGLHFFSDARFLIG